MGSGKSTIATVLAELIGFDALDTDEMIVARSGMTIEQIFETKGEPAFRELEIQALNDALAHSAPVVIATGGGVVTSESALDALKEHQGVVFLDVPIDVAAQRVGSNAALRPLLGVDPAADLARLDVVRRPLYEDVADLRIDVDARSTGEIAREIAAWGVCSHEAHLGPRSADEL